MALSAAACRVPTANPKIPLGSRGRRLAAGVTVRLPTLAMPKAMCTAASLQSWRNWLPPRRIGSVCGASRELSYSQPHNRPSRKSGQGTLSEVFNDFWRARGVRNKELLDQLVATGLDGIGDASASNDELDGQALGAWSAESAEGSTQVVAVSQRLADLVQLLGARGGHGDVDVVWMVVREPRLLAAKLVDLRAMLLQMKVAEGCEGLDVAKICEAQPSLLLQDPSSISEQESLAGRILAWKHGLISDSEDEWARQYAELVEYTRENGDAHVGCRDGDNGDLARWAKRQRASFRAGDLDKDRKTALESLNFAFSIDDAEWRRWYNELSTFHMINGHSNPAPLAAVTDLYLINWCGVQRIARRNGVMPEERIELLDVIRFDWTGADPLS